MSNNGIGSIVAAIDYIEVRLAEKMDLDIVANAVHYSKYHLHRSLLILLALAGVFNANVCDYGRSCMLLESTASYEKSDQLILLMGQYKDIEIVRSGAVAIEACDNFIFHYSTSLSIALYYITGAFSCFYVDKVYVYGLDEHIRHSGNFKAYRKIKTRYDELASLAEAAQKVKGFGAARKAQKALDTANEYYEAPRPELAQFEAAEKYLRGILQERFDPKKLPPITMWQKEQVKLTADKNRLNREFVAVRDDTKKSSNSDGALTTSCAGKTADTTQAGA